MVRDRPVLPSDQPVSELTATKAEVGALHDEETNPPVLAFRSAELDHAGAEDGEADGGEGFGPESPVPQLVQQIDVKRGEEGEQDDFVGMEVAKRLEEQDVHQSVLNAAQADEGEDVGGVQPRWPKERQQDQKRQCQPDTREDYRVNPGEEGLDQTERERPEAGNERKEKDRAGVLAHSGPLSRASLARMAVWTISVTRARTSGSTILPSSKAPPVA